MGFRKRVLSGLAGTPLGFDDQGPLAPLRPPPSCPCRRHSPYGSSPGPLTPAPLRSLVAPQACRRSCSPTTWVVQRPSPRRSHTRLGPSLRVHVGSCVHGRGEAGPPGLGPLSAAAGALAALGPAQSSVAGHRTLQPEGAAPTRPDRPDILKPLCPRTCPRRPPPEPRLATPWASTMTASAASLSTTRGTPTGPPSW